MKQIKDYAVFEVKSARSIEIPQNIETDFRKGDRVSIVAFESGLVIQKMKSQPVRKAISLLESIGKD